MQSAPALAGLDLDKKWLWIYDHDVLHSLFLMVGNGLLAGITVADQLQTPWVMATGEPAQVPPPENGPASLPAKGPQSAVAEKILLFEQKKVEELKTTREQSKDADMNSKKKPHQKTTELMFDHSCHTNKVDPPPRVGAQWPPSEPWQEAPFHSEKMKATPAEIHPSPLQEDPHHEAMENSIVYQMDKQKTIHLAKEEQLNKGVWWYDDIPLINKQPNTEASATKQSAMPSPTEEPIPSRADGPTLSATKVGLDFVDVEKWNAASTAEADLALSAVITAQAHTDDKLVPTAKVGVKKGKLGEKTEPDYDVINELLAPTANARGKQGKWRKYNEPEDKIEDEAPSKAKGKKGMPFVFCLDRYQDSLGEDEMTAALIKSCSKKLGIQIPGFVD